MLELKNSYLLGVIILLLLVRLGFSQNAYGEDSPNTKDDPNTDNKTVKFLKELPERKGSSNLASDKFNITSGLDLHYIVTTRFRKEMAILFSWLPELNQCNVLEAVSKETFCSVPDIVELLSNLTEIKHSFNVSCPFVDSKKDKICSLSKRSSVVKTIGNELLKVFATLPSTFKCHVINSIALAYNLKGRRHLTLSVSEAQNEVSKVFPSISLPQTCADMEMHHLIPTIPPVNITVNLSTGNKTSWLISFTKKGPDIYRTVLEYERETYHKDKVLGPGSTAQYLAENKETIDSTQLVTVGVFGGSKKFSVLFRLKVKRKQSNRLREMRSTYKIVQALAAKKQNGLREIFDATIITISLSGARSNITKTPPKTNKWTLNQINKAKDLFPAHLSEYYKHLGKPARCFVVLYISRKIKKTPKEVEMFYSSFGHLSRKHTCYYTRRTVPTDTTIEITEERFTQENTLTTRVPSVTDRTATPLNGSDGSVDHISEKVVKEDFSTLEIALFTLLGLLCIAILAFTVNCVRVSALRPKPAANSVVRNSTVQTALFRKDTSTVVTGNNRNDTVHFTGRIERNGRHFKPPGNQHLSARETNIFDNKLNHDCLKLNSLQLHHIGESDNERGCSESFQSQTEIGGQDISTNTRAHTENEYCLDSSPQQQRRDNDVVELPWRKHNPCETACQRTRKEVLDDSVQDNDTVLESQGRAISYCSIFDASSKVQPHRTLHTGCPPSAESHEMVVVLLDGEGPTEERFDVVYLNAESS